MRSFSPRAVRLIGATALLVLSAAPAFSAEDERSSALQITFADYQPSIDDQFATSPGPYEQVFGGETSLMFEIGWEGHLVRDAGALTAGLSIGFWSVQGNAILAGGTQGADTTSFQILPISAQLSYRFDVFAERYFPLAPVARVGVDYYLWRVLDGTGEVAYFSPGNDAQGSTYGWHAAVGVHLLLDFFAPDMAIAFERNAGVYNSFLIAEYRYSQIDEFGSASSFRLGDDAFVFGLALEL